MHFHNRTFESTYLKLIFEQTEEGVQFKYICKDCNTGFAEDDGFAEGDACPCEDCDGKLEECVIDDLDPNNMPAQYQANDAATEQSDKAAEEANDEQDEDFQDEDDFCDDQDEDFQDEDDLCDDQDEDFQDEDDLCDDQDEDFQDEEADEEAAEDADDKAAAEDADDKSDKDQEQIKLVSFTTDNQTLLEIFEQLKNNEVKLVAVPLDFKFDEKEMDELPAITMDTVGNFAIDDMNEQQEDNEDAETEADADTEAEGEEDTESKEQEIAKEAKKKFNAFTKPAKYGIY